MSVINKMLRDLERRRATPAEVAGAVQGAVRATAAPRRGARLLALLLLGGSAATATVFGDWPALLGATAATLPRPVQLADAAEPALPARLAAPRAITPSPPAAEPAAATPTPIPTAPTRATAPAEKTPAPEPAATLARAHPAATPARAAAPPPPPPVPAHPARPASMTPASAAPPTLIAAASIDKRMAALPAAQRAQALYRQGLELVGTGHGRQALERLHEALKLDPALLAARIHGVSLLLEQGRGAEAETLVRDGLALAGDEPQLTTLLARVLADRGDSAGALALLGRGERLGADGFGLRAGLLSQQGDFQRALPDYEQAVRLQPGNSLWWLGMGVALEAEGRGQQARQVYVRAQSLGLERSELNSFIEQKLQQLD